VKKILSILLLMIYTAASSGTVISAHYCMGDLAGISIGEQESDGCAFCGMEDKGCCHDLPQVIKIDNSILEGQVIPVVDFHPSWSIAPVASPHDGVIKGAPKVIYNFFPQYFSPPPQYLLHCNFRI
jgi:hypothetical protein